jgi:dolichyldiphosphatase
MGFTQGTCKMTMFKSLSFTHVQYNPAIPHTKLLAYITLSPQALVVSYVTLIYTQRDLATVWMLLGQTLNELLNYGLKRYIQQPRPTTFLGKGYGMPSSHAQFMSFFAVYYTLWFVVYLRHTPIAHGWRRMIQWCAVLMAWILSTVVCFSRWYLLYHTIEQVLCGFCIGSCIAALWFVVVVYCIYPLVDYLHIVPGAIGQMFLLQDSRHIFPLEFQREALLKQKTLQKKRQ